MTINSTAIHETALSPAEIEPNQVVNTSRTTEAFENSDQTRTSLKPKTDASLEQSSTTPALPPKPNSDTKAPETGPPAGWERKPGFDSRFQYLDQYADLPEQDRDFINNLDRRHKERKINERPQYYLDELSPILEHDPGIDPETGLLPDAPEQGIIKKGDQTQVFAEPPEQSLTERIPDKTDRITQANADSQAIDIDALPPQGGNSRGNRVHFDEGQDGAVGYGDVDPVFNGPDRKGDDPFFTPQPDYLLPSPSGEAKNAEEAQKNRSLLYSNLTHRMEHAGEFSPDDPFTEAEQSFCE